MSPSFNYIKKESDLCNSHQHTTLYHFYVHPGWLWRGFARLPTFPLLGPFQTPCGHFQSQLCIQTQYLRSKYLKPWHLHATLQADATHHMLFLNLSSTLAERFSVETGFAYSQQPSIGEKSTLRWSRIMAWQVTEPNAAWGNELWNTNSR